MKLVISYNKIIMHDIKNNYTIFIYFAITNYITTWCGGWVVKTLDCGWGSEDSKHNEPHSSNSNFIYFSTI
jgi:hypothetical protein